MEVNHVCVTQLISVINSHKYNICSHSHKYNICKYDLFCTKPLMWCHKINNSVQPADSTLVITEIIKDMLHCRESYNYLFFKLHEINTILLTMCTA